MLPCVECSEVPFWRGLLWLLDRSELLRALLCAEGAHAAGVGQPRAYWLHRLTLVSFSGAACPSPGWEVLVGIREHGHTQHSAVWGHLSAQVVAQT